MIFTTPRIGLLVCAVILSVTTLLAQATIYQIPPTVTGTQINDLDRRVANLEESKTDARLVRIETLLQESAKSSEATRQTMVAVLVPVICLTLEALFRLGSALQLRKKP